MSLTNPSEKKKKTKKKPESPSTEDAPPSSNADFPIVFNMGSPDGEPKEKIRTIGLYGTIKEEVCAELVYALIVLDKTGKSIELADPEDPESQEIVSYEPIEFIISSYGGSAADMFAVYDIMRDVRDRCEIHTQGLGKVMSAAVLLLSAGTKGKRRIGRHCRVMIHGVISGQHGHLSDLENEMCAAKWTQQQYIRALAKETNMAQKYIKKLIDKKMNVYLTAQDAVDLGIADIIV
jgi:ATP-dependent Clp endopeptidase proteolytic subunit ClpP